MHFGVQIQKNVGKICLAPAVHFISTNKSERIKSSGDAAKNG